MSISGTLHDCRFKQWLPDISQGEWLPPWGYDVVVRRFILDSPLHSSDPCQLEQVKLERHLVIMMQQQGKVERHLAINGPQQVKLENIFFWFNLITSNAGIPSEVLAADDSSIIRIQVPVMEPTEGRPLRSRRQPDHYGSKRNVEALWRDFFSNPSQWWDHRPEKINPRFPDFKHKQTQEPLWLVDARNPEWVQAEITSILPGVLQSNPFTWGQRLKRHAKSGQYKKTMEVFQQMLQERIVPDARTFLPVLNACAGLGALVEGQKVHTQIIQVGCESDVYVATCLVNMYAKCGSIEKAWSVFNKMPERDVVSWNTMIGGYVKAGQGLRAMELFQEMQHEGLEPDIVTFVGVLNACANLTALEEGRRVHSRIIQSGWESDVYIATCLVDMYAKCGSIEDAWTVFNKMQEPDVVTWSAMIVGYVKSGQGPKALELFQKMQQQGMEPDIVSFVGVLNACASIAALEEGRCVHEQIIRRGLQSDIYLGSCLVDMYAKCGSIEDACTVFNKMRKHDVVTWNVMIGAYAIHGQAKQATDAFRQMQHERVCPNARTFLPVLNACASLKALEEGRHIHAQILQVGCESDVYVATCLVDMYAKCGDIDDAWAIFNKMQEHNVVTWNALIVGYGKLGQGLKAIRLFQEMQQEGVQPDTITFVGVLTACANLVALDEGRRIHAQIIQVGCESDVYVATCLVDMYSKCGSLGDALSVFKEMREHNVVAWNAMILGYVKSGQGLKAMQLFQNMEQEGVHPDAITFVGVLSACASVAALEEGKCVHEQIIRKRYESDIYVANCLVHMYAKCGSIEDAWNVFNKTGDHNVVTWNVMIGGFAMHGQAKKAIGLFRLMSKGDVEISGITFTGLLSACSHGGLVKEGLRYFKCMSSCWNVLPTVEHYACMVDLLGRAGQLQEAEELMKRMPLESDVSIWMSLLGASRTHGNIKMADRTAKRCWELDPGNASAYMLLWNTHAAAGNLISVQQPGNRC